MAIMPPLPNPMTLAALQAWVEEMKAANGFTPTDFRHEMVLLMEEVGEVAKAYRKTLKTAHLRDDQRIQEDSVGEELADVLIFLLSLANMSGTNFEQAFAAKIEKNRQREWKPNTPA
jgi:NTP pyrophosphatase (non-canonical NTP hydrolase)